MRHSCSALILLVAATSAALVVGTARGDIPANPRQLTFPELQFEAPKAAEYRHELSNGVPVFIAPSHEFPLVTISFTFRGGTYLDPADQVGLGSALGAMMRRGGTETVSAEEMDERFDFLAANVNSFVGSESSGASINCLTSNFDEAFVLFMDMVRHPGFDAERLRVWQDQEIEELKQRNDAPFSVMGLYMGRLIYGPDHYTARNETKQSLESITPEALRAMHQRIFHPGNLYVAVTGDVEPDAILATLEEALSGWEKSERSPNPPAPSEELKPGMYHAAVAQQDLPQGTTLIATRTIERDHPDAIPMQVMNHILGGSGFTSRITNRVRSDEGLAYSASSFIQPNVYYPGPFGAFFQSKNPTVALATKIIMDEINRIRAEAVSEAELETARSAFINQFPQRFASKSNMLSVFVNDAMTDRPANYWQTYREEVRNVTADDVQRVARAYLNPDEMLIFVIGDWDAIYPGDPEGRASMNDFFEGNVTHLPTLDPLTLEPK